jgi:ATP-dependent helicase/DNAse subunit B
MLEQKFGVENKDKKTLPGIKLNVRDKDIIFKGQIDRVDQYDDKVYIIDYKTYKNADINLSELYFGKQIQLFLYMRALQKLNYNPVGVFYQPIYATYDKDVEVNRFKFKGVVHNTPGIQESIDPDYLKDKEKSFAAYEMIGRAPNKVEDPETIMDPAKMDMLGEYSEDVARSGVEDIMDGLIEPLPYAGSCTNCAYKKICGYIQDNERNKQTVHLKTYENIYAPAEEEFVEPEVYKYARNEDIR